MRLPGASQTKKGRVSVRLPLSAGPETTCKKCINSRHFYCRGPFFRVGFSSRGGCFDRALTLDAFGRGGAGGAKNWKVRMGGTMMQQQGNGRQDGPDQGQGGKQSFYVFHVNRVLWKVYLIR